jgi:hypothetical protein
MTRATSKALIAVLLLCGVVAGQQTAPETYRCIVCPSGNGECAPAPCLPEPIDVPATLFKAIAIDCKYAKNNGRAYQDGYGHCFLTVPPSCADRTRILAHDEQTPPKWWCRKAEP